MRDGFGNVDNIGTGNDQHLTASAGQIWRFSNAEVPLPAPLWMLLGGLVAMRAARRARATG